MWERLVATIIGKCQTELIAVKKHSHNMLNFLAGKQISFFGQIGRFTANGRAEPWNSESINPEPTNPEPFKPEQRDLLFLVFLDITMEYE